MPSCIEAGAVENRENDNNDDHYKFSCWALRGLVDGILPSRIDPNGLGDGV